MAEPVPEFDAAHFLDTHGLGPDELRQNVAFGDFRGTVEEMLADPKCPVGGIIAEAYREKGLSGVEDKFRSLGALSSSFVVEISAGTRDYHEGSRTRDEVLGQAPEHLGFLA